MCRLCSRVTCHVCACIRLRELIADRLVYVAGVSLDVQARCKHVAATAVIHPKVPSTLVHVHVRTLAVSQATSAFSELLHVPSSRQFGTTHRRAIAVHAFAMREWLHLDGKPLPCICFNNKMGLTGVSGRNGFDYCTSVSGEQRQRPVEEQILRESKAASTCYWRDGGQVSFQRWKRS